MNWLALSFTGLFSLSIMSFFITFLARKGYPVSFILLGIALVVTFFNFFQTFVLQQYKFAFSPGTIGLLLLIGLLSAVGNITIYQAANNAPNAGLAIGIAGMQSVVVALLAIFFLKDKITAFQIAGLFLSIVAIFLMSMGNTNTNTKSQIAQSKNITAKK